MAPGFFTPSKTNSFSAFQLTLPLVPLYNPCQSSPTVSFINRDTNSHNLCSAFITHLPVRYGSRNTKLCSINLYLSFSLLLCFPVSRPFLENFGPWVNTQIKIFSFEHTHFFILCLGQHPDRNSAFFLGGLVGEPKLSFLCEFEIEWGLKRLGVIESVIRSHVNCPRRQTRIREASPGRPGDEERGCRRFRNFSRLASKCLPMERPGLCHPLKISNGYELFWVCIACLYTKVELNFVFKCDLFIWVGMRVLKFD